MDPTFERLLHELKGRSTPSQDLKVLISILLSILGKDLKETKSFTNVEDILKLHLEQTLGKTQSERLFNVYRPVYAKALSRANITEKLKTVNYEQFNVLIKALFVYALMIDSFFRLCGDASHLNRNTARIDREEFMKRYERVMGYNLAGCDNIRNQKEADLVFDIISVDDGVTMGLEDWINYLSKAEVSLKTDFGLILREEQVAPDQLPSTINTKQAKVVTIDSSLFSCPTRSRGSSANLSTAPSRGSSEEYLSSSTKSGMVSRSKSRGSMEKLSTTSSRGSFDENISSSTKSGMVSRTKSFENLSTSTKSVLSEIQVNFTIGAASSPTLNFFFQAFEAYTPKTSNGQKSRFQGFKIADQSSTGRCTLTDLESFIQHALRAKFSSGQSDDLFRIYQPSFLKAFLTTKVLGTSSTSDSISITSFRLFVVCLLIYTAIYDSFRLAMTEEVIESEPNLDKATFVRRYRKIQGSGFVGIDNIIDEEAAISIFDLMTATNNDTVSFSEWVDYVEKAEMRMSTDLGQFLSQKRSSTPSDTSVVMSVSGCGPIVKTAISPQSLMNSSDLKQLEIPSVCTVGIAVTPNLRDFVETFKPFTDKSVEGQKLRVKEFKELNTDGSGRCSLSDLEIFIKRLLATRFESSQSFYLFHLFRPSFARAYVKAHAFKEYISVTEFRIFTVFSCLYACMYDAYSKIPVEGDFITAEDFEARFERLHGYDFAALTCIREKEQAKDSFLAMDKSARGFIDFDDFCFWLEKVEMSNKTKLGEFLSYNSRLALRNRNEHNVSRSLHVMP